MSVKKRRTLSDGPSLEQAYAHMMNQEAKLPHAPPCQPRPVAVVSHKASSPERFHASFVASLGVRAGKRWAMCKTCDPYDDDFDGNPLPQPCGLHRRWRACAWRRAMTGQQKEYDYPIQAGCPWLSEPSRSSDIGGELEAGSIGVRSVIEPTLE